MAEQTFRSPGFFEQEIDLSERQGSLIGIPAGVIGTAMKGPAFVPVTIGTFVDFENRFGTLDPELFGPYAVREFLKHRNAVTYMRVLGAGANQTEADLATTAVEGTVKNAGLKVESVAATGPIGGHDGAVQFLVARHELNSHEIYGYPMYTDNSSYTSDGSGGDFVNLVRGVVMTPSGTRMQILDHNQAWSVANASDSLATVGDGAGIGEPYFKLVVSSTAASSFSNDEGQVGIRIFTASLDPHSRHYVGKVLNTDPDRFQELQHLLYLDLPVENEIMSASGDANSIGLLSGTAGTTTSGGDTTTPYRNLFGRMDTRYTTPRTPAIISQPFGSVEYDLFHFETISDGAATNEEFKVSIANIRKSTDPANDYGIFDVQVRRMTDTDILPEVIEYYPAVNLNPKSEDYIARKIGDRKVYYNFDTTDPDEQRLIVEGKYPNRSINIRVVMNESVEKGEVTALALPFGFRGIPVLKTGNSLSDNNLSALTDRFGRSIGSSGVRLAELGGSVDAAVTGSIVPPLPFRFKATRGEVKSDNPGFLGDPGSAERADNRYYWGVKFERMPLSSSVGAEGTDNAVLNSNVSSVPNPLVRAYGKFQGITKLDTLVSGTGADLFNDNKFTLSRVALYNTLDASGHITDVSGTAAEHMLQAAYVRNGTPDATNYTVVDGIDAARSRITLGTLVHTSSAVFNRFQEYNKFSTLFYGGFDGVNLLDRDNRLLNDRASSVDTGGKAGSSIDGGLGLVGTNNGTMSGIGKDNNIVAAYRAATKIVTDPLASNINILTIPGIRDTQVTDFALGAVRDYSLAIYLMDPLTYDADVNRLFDDSTVTPDVRETAEQFEARAIDNNYGASYFPDVFIQDDVNNRPVRVPSSVAAISALAFNDKVAYPWFAPAGFNRAALADVRRVAIRLNSEDRDVLYDARLNPIATFPAGGFVIFGQKTLQQARSALDRVNVRRLLLEVKRLVAGVARRLLFEQNDATTRAQFVSQVTPLLALIQSQSGIERFQVVCDETNNTQEDVDANKMNGRIVLVPTRAVEFISIDFIVTNSGVSFE